MSLWAAEVFRQNLDPLNSPWLSTILAALPVVALFVFLVPMRWLAPKAALGAAVLAILVAIFVFNMPFPKAFAAMGYGMAFGLMPVGWNILCAMFLYNITVETGQFAIIRRSVASVSPDVRIQAILVGFCFGAFLEGAAGGGTPVAICAAIMVGLGFKPFQAAILCLIANTSPVAFGGLGSPLIVLGGVTGLSTDMLSVMAGFQLPLFSLLIPIWMVKCMATWKQTWEVMPALLVAGGSFAAFQFTFATLHYWVPSVVLYNMTDIGGGIFALLTTALFLRYWKPKNIMVYELPKIVTVNAGLEWSESAPLIARRVFTAWSPYVLMSVALFSAGLLRQTEIRNTPRVVHFIGPFQSNYTFPVPYLYESVYRDDQLRLKDKDKKPVPEPASYELSWATAAGTAVLLAALVSIAMLRMNREQVWNVIKKTVWQMRIPIPTIALMLGLSYVTRFSGMDASLGFAFAGTGVMYPFFAAILGWLGVFLTGTDAGSNALFGSLQKIAATTVYQQHGVAFGSLSLDQAQTLICTTNSTGGVMGKMIDAQSICVSTAATNQIGREADIFKSVVWHSIVLACLIGMLALLQAYVWPFQAMVPK
ncbi:MAG TPA: L-lactate permease [Gemmatales bacterium]|nr:L-lactate permease [Gemmatales bacterium]